MAKRLPLFASAFILAAFTMSVAAQNVHPSILLGVLNDKAEYLPKPAFPSSAVDLKGVGDIFVQITIDLQSGRVTAAKAIAGHAALRSYAERAALQARFKPKKEIEGPPLFARGVLRYDNPLSRNKRKTGPKMGLPVIVTGIVNGRVLMPLPKPQFPKDCECFGKVKIRIVVDLSGTVLEAAAVSGDDRLFDSAIDAARKTRFSPTNINGPPTFVVGYLEYEYKPNRTIEMPF